MTSEQDAAKWAKGMAEELPDKYQVAGFQEFLRHKLAALRDVDNTASSTTTNRLANKEEQPAAIEWLDEIYADLPEDHIIRQGGSEVQKVGWAVLGLVRSRQEAVNNAMGEFIRVNLGIAPPGRQNINRALRKLVPKYLSRQKSGKGYAYTPKPALKELFADLKGNGS